MSEPGTISDTSACKRFEEEALLHVERGLPLNAHFGTCPACRSARASCEQLFARLGGLGHAHAGRSDWRAQVWSGVSSRPARRPARAPWWLALPMAAVAAGAFLLSRAAPAGPALALALHESVQDGTSMRGRHAQPGDTLEIRVLTGGAAQAELRVYRDDHELIVRCADEPPCTRHGDAITASLVLGERGKYQIAFLHGEQALPAPTHELDHDLAMAQTMGAAVDLRDLHVR
jgi:hypothetical protein